MKIGIYPGSFDPITYGHIDIIERAAKITDKLIVSVLNNSAKDPLFSVNERVEMIKKAVEEFDNVEVESFEGLTVDYCKAKKASFMIRGLRAVTDFEYELQLAQTNRALYDKVDTVFLLTNLNYAYLSSSAVKQVIKYGGDVSKFVPQYVEAKLKEKYSK
ncbi:MAG: pantetheine-phosphate adenylyltransferase [Lachnospiraceae bacterium]|nr:pantetheine-phosphate adenylyltransferase [Lachnospiraceae bacterium]